MSGNVRQCQAMNIRSGYRVGRTSDEFGALGVVVVGEVVSLAFQGLEGFVEDGLILVVEGPLVGEGQRQRSDSGA